MGKYQRSFCYIFDARVNRKWHFSDFLCHLHQGMPPFLVLNMELVAILVRHIELEVKPDPKYN